MWWEIWSVATTSIGFWTWIWSRRHWTGTGSGLLISMLEKLHWFCLTSLTTLVLLEKSYFKMLGLTFSSNFRLDLLHYLYCQKCLQENCGLHLLCEVCFSWSCSINTVVMSGLVLLFATWNCRISYKNRYAGLLVLQFLVHYQNVASLSFFYRYMVDVHLNWLNWFHFLILKRGLLIILVNCMILCHHS